MGNLYLKKGLSYSLLSGPSSDKFSVASKGNGEQREKISSSAGDQRSLSETGNRRNSGNKPRFLQSSLRGSEEKWQTPADNRSLFSKPVYSSRSVQNGNHSVYSRSHSPRRMGGFHRLEGCLPSRPHSPLVPEVSPVRIRGENLSVSRASLRDKLGTFRVHETDDGRGIRSPEVGVPSDPIFRRLVTTPVTSNVPPSQSENGLGYHPGSGFDSQQGEIGISSVSNLHLCRDVLPDPSGLSVRPSSEGRRDCSAGQSSVAHEVTHCQVLPLPSGSLERCRGSSSVRQTSYETTTNVPPLSLETDQGSGGCLDPHSPSGPASPSLVVEQEETSVGCPDFSSRPIRHSVDRCVIGRLGSPLGAHGPPSQRALVSDREAGTHQQLRVEGCIPVHSSLSSSCQRTMRDDSVRQYHGSLLHSETGRNALDISVCRGEGSAALVLRSPDYSQSKTYPRTAERPSGLFVKGGERYSLGVVSSPLNSSRMHSAVGATDGGPIRRQAKPQASSLHLSSTGRSCDGTGCPLHELGRTRCLCIPALQSSEHCSQEDNAVVLSGNPGCPSVASQVVVQPATDAVSGETQGPPHHSRPSLSARRPHIASQSGLPPPSRVEALKRSVAKRGFSSKAAGFIAQAKRPSTSSVYDAKWRIFTDWCVRRKVNPLRPSLGKIADFLIYLFQERNCSPSTIKGYRSALSNTLKFGRGRGKDLGSDPRLSEIIRHFERVRPAIRSVSPKWNLSCVLWSLTKPPYEPMLSASLLNTSVKTVFLLAFASAKRRSELHALSMDEGSLRFSKDSVTLHLEPGFLPKTQVPNKLPAPIVIPSLDRLCGPNDKDRLLCPVRALKFYLERSKGSRLSRKRLFIPVKGKGDISPATISRWIRMAVLRAYGDLSDVNLTFLKIKAHEVRALATSWAYHNRIPSEDILQAASWLNHSTFSNFYLRSLSSQEEGLFRLGPLVSAQRVISH